MAAMSRHVFNEAVGGLTCHQLFHPWSPTCTGALGRISCDSFKGSLRFYTIIYLAQLAMQAKNIRSKKMWVRMGEYFCRSFLLGFLVPFTFTTSNCFISNVLGLRHSYLTSLLIPLTCSGTTIYLEPPSRRGLVVNVFVNQMIEYCMKCLSRANYLDMTKKKQVFMFMVGSSLLFYLMRLEGEKEHRTPLFWLYTAEKVNKETEDTMTVCPHKGPCQKYILKGFGTYFGIGLAISLAKLLLPKIRSPLRALSSIRTKHFKMAMFFGSYIGIYRAVICYLCRKDGKDAEKHALPAGFLAGISMVFNPNLGLAIASLTGAMKLYSTTLYEKKIIPENIPLPEILYCCCQGILFSARFMDPEVCPSYIRNLTDTVSNGHCEAVYRRALDIATRNQLLEKIN